MRQTNRCDKDLAVSALGVPCLAPRSAGERRSQPCSMGRGMSAVIAFLPWLEGLPRESLPQRVRKVKLKCHICVSFIFTVVQKLLLNLWLSVLITLDFSFILLSDSSLSLMLHGMLSNSCIKCTVCPPFSISILSVITVISPKISAIALQCPWCYILPFLGSPQMKGLPC